MGKITLISIVALIFLIGGNPSFGQMLYKWTDEKGVVHFSDTPPSAAKEEKKAPKENGLDVLKKADAPPDNGKMYIGRGAAGSSGSSSGSSRGTTIRRSSS